MADAAVTITRVVLPKEVFKEGAIRSDQFIAEVTVTVPSQGCYAVIVKLVQDKFLIPNNIIGTDDSGTVTCYCFDKDHLKRDFFVRGGGDPPKGKKEQKAQNGGKPLDPISGKWPPDDGLFDNTLQVFVEVRVYPCGPETCTGDTCENDLSMQELPKPIGSVRSKVCDVDVVDGLGVDKGVQVIEKVAGAGASVGGSFAPKLEQPVDPKKKKKKGKKAARLLRLEKRLYRLEQRVKGE